jgi:hypothetical protein
MFGQSGRFAIILFDPFRYRRGKESVKASTSGIADNVPNKFQAGKSNLKTMYIMFSPGVNPTTVSYNASIVKNCNK